MTIGIFEAQKSFRQQWRAALKPYFLAPTPKKMEWHGQKDIAFALRNIPGDFNHLFYPTGGGNILKRIRMSHEPTCLELDTEGVQIIKPYRLVFCQVSDDLANAFFWLETSELDPTGIYEDHPGIREALTEISPGQYADFSVSDRGYIDGPDGEEPLPETARRVSRYLQPANFVISCKGGLYNCTKSQAPQLDFDAYLQDHGGLGHGPNVRGNLEAFFPFMESLAKLARYGD